MREEEVMLLNIHFVCLLLLSASAYLYIEELKSKYCISGTKIYSFTIPATIDNFLECDCLNLTDCYTITGTALGCAPIVDAKLATGICFGGKELSQNKLTFFNCLKILIAISFSTGINLGTPVTISCASSLCYDLTVRWFLQKW